MTYKKLKDLVPAIVDINQNPYGRPDPRFQGRQTYVGDNIKRVSNLKNDMALQEMFVHGELKSVGWDRVCGQCINFYKDSNLTNKKHGRCRAYGFKEVHEELTAEVKHNYTEPDGQFTFSEWPGCSTWTSRERMSRR